MTDHTTHSYDQPRRQEQPVNPEDVPAEMVERAAEAAFLDRWPTKVTGYTWDMADETPQDMYRSQARAALAAVLPEIQAQAFEAAAVRVRANFAAHGERCPWVGFLDDEAARLRAARLTTTTEDRKTADEWCQILGVTIIDPDGWRADCAAWGALLTEAEFHQRAARSTIAPLAPAEGPPCVSCGERRAWRAPGHCLQPYNHTTERTTT